MQKTAQLARRAFERRACDRRLLASLYRQYNPAVGDAALFVDRALVIFPRLSCGLASLYLKHVLQEGEVVQGRFRSMPHTVLLVRHHMVDITADQFGGPAVYVGPAIQPWRLPSVRRGIGRKGVGAARPISRQGF